MIDVGVIGLGLIGGSISMNFAQGLNVAGFDVDPRTMELACQKKAITYPITHLEELSPAKLIFVATPPRFVPDIVSRLNEIVRPDTVITDCSSVKQSIFENEKRGEVRLGSNFVGGHPMAGKERSGIENARSDLFEGAAWILTPTANTSSRALDFMIETVQTFGAQPFVMTPEQHDRAVALVSHWPHLLASLMVQIAHRDGSDKVSAGAWDSLTRIAASDPNLWTEITLANSDFIADRIEETLVEIQNVLPLIREGRRDEIQAYFETGREIKKMGQVD